MLGIADRILFYFFLVPLSYLPLSVLYFVGARLHYLIYYFIRYRRKVVRTNLVKAFPDKTIQEIRTIERGFYRHFMRFIAESVKARSIGAEEVLERTKIKNPELIEELYKKGKSVIVLCGHYNNWEFYSLSLHRQVPYKTYSVYQPLSNSFFNKVIYKSRTRTGMRLIKAKELVGFLKATSAEQKLIVVVNDQSPTNVKTAYWNRFLNQETGWNIGAERIARKFGIAVVFGHSEEVKRGFYEVTFRTISVDHHRSEDGDITDGYSRILEELILKKPTNWLWSHKRWKRKKPVGKTQIIPIAEARA